MIGLVLHYILSYKACEMHFCTMRLYCKHHFFYLKLTGSNIRAFVFFIVMLKHFWSICYCNFQNLPKKALSQVSVNRRSGHLIELNATELKSFTCG